MVIQKPFLDPQKRIDLAVADIARRVRFSGLFTRIDGDVFRGTAGTGTNAGKGVVHYETEAVTVARDYEWRTRKMPVQYDDIFRSSLAIVIDKHMTQGVRWTPEEDFIDDISYARDILPPATEALARRLNAKVESAIINASDLKVTNLTLTAVGDPEGKNVLRQVLAIKAACDKAGMPKAGRKLLLGANAFVHVLAADATRTYDPAQALTAYRRGAPGVISEFEIVDGTDLLGENEFRVIHPSWLIMPTAAGDLPTTGVAWAAKASIDGYAARIVRGYSMDYDREGQVIHTYYGLNELKDELDRHTRASAAAANDGSVADDPKIDEDGKLLTTGKNVRHAKGTFTPAT